MKTVTEPQPGTIDAERELRAIIARVRLRTYRLIAWSEHRREQREGWPDRWQHRADRASWGQTDERGRELSAGLAEVERVVTAAPRLARLCGTLGLDDRERDVLEVCLAAAIDPGIAASLAAATGRALPTESVIAEVFDHEIARVVTPDSALARWDLVHRVPLGVDAEGLIIDPAIADWFTGAYAVEVELVGIARTVEPPPVLVERWPIDDLVATISSRWNRRELAPYTRVVIVAPSGAGRRSFAAAVADRLGLGVLALDGDAVDEQAWPRTALRAHRQAYLSQHALALVGDVAVRRGLPRGVPPFPLVFAIVEPGALPPAADPTVDIVIELPAPQIADRVALWRRLVTAAARWPAADLDNLARRHRVLPGDVAYAASRGVAQIEDAAKVVRERGRGRLGELASRLECPFTWQDLVLPGSVLDVLRDFAFEARERATVWETPAIRRLFPHGRGLFALLTGMPGTGKTMAAQAIAAELGLDLYRISLATVVSKYVGETAKNLERILARAETMDAVLLFDEADALFGKRTEIKDAHDRYANTDTNHLLQAIESFGGIAILASNKKANVDPAFVRRLRYVVELPRPDQAQRRILWARLVAELCNPAIARELAAVLDAAAAIEATGAQIKYAVLAALFAARRDACDVGARQLVRGFERELLKEGRSLSERERERLVGA